MAADQQLVNPIEIPDEEDARIEQAKEEAKKMINEMKAEGVPNEAPAKDKPKSSRGPRGPYKKKEQPEKKAKVLKVPEKIPEKIPEDDDEEDGEDFEILPPQPKWEDDVEKITCEYEQEIWKFIWRGQIDQETTGQFGLYGAPIFVQLENYGEKWETIDGTSSSPLRFILNLIFKCFS